MRESVRGITLIEILVVLVIISVLVSSVVLLIPDSRSDRLERDAKRLIALTDIAQEQALFNGEDLALSFSQQGYSFMQREEGLWLSMENDNLLHPRELPEDMHLSLFLEGIDVELPVLPKNKPQVFILSDGTMTPFKLNIADDASLSFNLVADALGKMELLSVKR